MGLMKEEINLARKKQTEKIDIDLSKFRRVDKPTNYPVYIGIPNEVLEERMAKMYLYMQKTLREKELKEGC